MHSKLASGKWPHPTHAYRRIQRWLAGLGAAVHEPVYISSEPQVVTQAKWVRDLITQIYLREPSVDPSNSFTGRRTRLSTVGTARSPFIEAPVRALLCDENFEPEWVRTKLAACSVAVCMLTWTYGLERNDCSASTDFEWVLAHSETPVIWLDMRTLPRPSWVSREHLARQPPLLRRRQGGGGAQDAETAGTEISVSRLRDGGREWYMVPWPTDGDGVALSKPLMECLGSILLARSGARHHAISPVAAQVRSTEGTKVPVEGGKEVNSGGRTPEGVEAN